MGKDEWLALPESTRPALRFCAPDGTPTYVISKTSKKGTCEWCGCGLWFDAAQEMPEFIRARGTVMICATCALADDEMAAAIIKNLPAVYEGWVKTGIVKPFRFGESEEK